MVRLKNTTSWKSVDDILEPKEKGDYVGMSNNRPVIVNRDEFLTRISSIKCQDNCLNSCSSPFIIPFGLIGESETITIDPMKVGNIELKETITKSLRGLFQEGNNNGCKDETYSKWNQPIMDYYETNLGECSQTSGIMINEAWKAMNGVFNAKEDGWKSEGLTTTWQFKSVIPFIIESIIFTNTDDEYKSKLITIQTDSDTLRADYYMNVDNLGKSYLLIEPSKRKESDTLNIVSSNYNNKGGFNEVEINALTKYVQQDSSYNVFLISDGQKVDVLLSYDEKPILPEGFTEYEFVKTVYTAQDAIALEATYGDRLKFNTEEMPATITKDSQHYVISDIDDIVIDSEDAGKYYIYLSTDGQAYYDNTQRDDIKIGEIFVKNHNIVKLIQYPCNYNGEYAYTNATLKLFEEDAISNYSYQIEHGLGDTSNWHLEALLKCFKEDNSYSKGDTTWLPEGNIPSLNDSFITLNTNDLTTINKYNGSSQSLAEHSWKIIFRLFKE